MKDAEIIPEVREAMHPAYNRTVLYAALALLVVLSWNTWWGDALIYLSYSAPFQFNPGEFSASMTSPIWHLLTGGLSPAWFKLFSAFVAFVALWAVMESQKRTGAALIAGALCFPVLFYGVMGYETALAVLLTVDLWREPRLRYAWALPLVRPESVLLLVWVYRKDFKALGLSLLPFFVWAVIAYAYGNGLTSIETRAGHFDVRYLSVFWVWGTLTFADSYRRSYLPVLLLVALAPIKTLQTSYRDMSKGWDYDTVTLKTVAGYINARYDSVTVGAYEIQIRRELKPSIRLASTEGLAGDGLPTVWVATDRNDNGTKTVQRWDYRREGFLQWVEVRE